MTKFHFIKEGDEELTPEQLKERHQQGMMEDLMETSNKWYKEHGIDPKDAGPDEPLN